MNTPPLRGWEASELGFSGGTPKLIERKLAVEQPLTIYLNGRHYATFLVSPGLRRELIIGHLFSMGIIDSKDEILEIEEKRFRADVKLKGEKQVDDERIYRLISTACGVSSKGVFAEELKLPKLTYDGEITVDRILNIYRDVNMRAEIYRSTRGTHLAAIYTENSDNLSFAEDVGRHNAVDKVIGDLILKGKLKEGLILVTSGRPTIDIVLRALRLRVPFVLSLSMPTYRSVETAKMKNLTLISVKGRIIVFTGKKRVEVT